MSLSAMNWALKTHTRGGRGGADETPLSVPERLVLITLAHHENRSTRRCNPSIETLTDEAGVSRSSVLRHLRVLSTAGLITITQAKHRKGWASNVYTLAVPEEYRAVDERRPLPAGPGSGRDLSKPRRAPVDWMNAEPSRRPTLRERYAGRELPSPAEQRVLDERRERELEAGYRKEQERDRALARPSDSQ